MAEVKIIPGSLYVVRGVATSPGPLADSNLLAEITKHSLLISPSGLMPEERGL